MEYSKDYSTSRRCRFQAHSEDMSKHNQCKSYSLTWIHSKNGEYIVKSGYHIQHELQRLNTRVNFSERSSEGDIKAICRTILKLETPRKIKHFCWRTAHSSIPVMPNLSWKGLRMDPRSIYFMWRGS